MQKINRRQFLSEIDGLSFLYFIMQVLYEPTSLEIRCIMLYNYKVASLYQIFFPVDILRFTNLSIGLVKRKRKRKKKWINKG